MESETRKSMEHGTEDAREAAQTLFVRQVEDKSLPALQILAERQQGLDSSQPPMLFIP